MDALLGGDIETATELIPVSDPLAISTVRDLTARTLNFLANVVYAT